MPLISESFDFRFRSLIVRYSDIGSRQQLRVVTQGELPETYSPDAESIIELVKPGAVILRGLNGAGKSRFLAGLAALGEKSLKQPQISIRYEIPPEDDYIEYLVAIERIKLRNYFEKNPDRTDFNDLDVMRANLDVWDQLNLPLHELLIDSISYRLVGQSFRSMLGVETASEALQFFGFPESEIQQFEKRLRTYEWEMNAAIPGFDDIRAHDKKNLNFREYFPEFFLSMICGSYFQNDEYYPGLGTFLMSSEWLKKDENRALVVDGLQDIFLGARYFDVSVGKDKNFVFSLVFVDEASKSLGDLNRVINQQRNSFENTTFPTDLLEEGNLISTRCCPLGYKYSRHNQPFSFSDLTFRSRKNSESEVIDLLDGFIRANPSEDAASSSYTVTWTGFDAFDSFLEESSRLLSETGVGVTALKRAAFTSKPGKITQWQDAVSHQWLAIEKLSDGQLDVVRVILRLVKAARQDKSQTTFILLDEFDRHLHPTAASKLLEILNRFGKKFGIYVVVSTHTVSRLVSENLRHSTILLASKDLDGRMTLTTDISEDPVIAADMLGASQLDVMRLKQLHIVVEGKHEEIIFKHLFRANNVDLGRIDILTQDGLYGLTSFWGNVLSHLDAPVLIVYDKRNQSFEKVWSEIQALVKKSQISMDIWSQFPAIKDLYFAVKERMRRNAREFGDTELKCICELVRHISKSPNKKRDVGRLHFHGIEYPDIVDSLDIANFPKASKSVKNKKFGSWKSLRDENPNMHPETFKHEYGITNRSVEKAAADMKSVDEELKRLLARVQGLIETWSQ